MKATLKPRRLSPHGGADAGKIYAYEGAAKWFLLDANSPCRGPAGAARLMGGLSREYNATGKIGLGTMRDINGDEHRLSYIPVAPVRVEARADSTIYTVTTPIPGGPGAIEDRYARANR